MGPWLSDNNRIRTVNLIGRHQLRLVATQSRRHHLPVFHHRRAVIAGTQPHIQRCKDPRRIATLPPKKSMGDGGVFQFIKLLHVETKG